MWPFLSKLPASFLYWTSLSSPLSARLYSFLVILLDFCSFRSLYPLITFIHLISLFCDLPVYLTFSLFSDVLSEEKVFYLAFVIFRLKVCAYPLFRSCDFLCVLVTCDLFSIYSVLPHCLLHISVSCLFSYFFSAFCLSILSFPIYLIFHVTFLLSTSQSQYIFHPFLCSHTPTTLSLDIFLV